MFLSDYLGARGVDVDGVEFFISPLSTNWPHVSADGRTLVVGGQYLGVGHVFRITLPAPCDADFDRDGSAGTTGDIAAFFSCLRGACSHCASADFNGDGDFGTDQDIEAFFRVLAGGSC
jgi:hypothetical protein